MEIRPSSACGHEARLYSRLAHYLARQHAVRRRISTGSRRNNGRLFPRGQRGFVTSLAALLPDTIRSIGLLAGCFSLVCAVSGELVRAAIMIGVSIACDITEGFVARSTRSVSRFGLEYDSLSDVVAFGVAPAILAYAWALAPLQVWAALVVGAFLVCAALRLARFNLLTESPVGRKRFVGLPVPGATAMIAGGFLGYSYFRFPFPRALSAAKTALMFTLA